MEVNVKFYILTNEEQNNLCNEILKEILNMSDTQEESLSEISRYKKEFPKEADYNIYQYGNLLIYNKDIEDLFKRNNVEFKDKDDYVKLYKEYIGVTVDFMLNTFTY